MKTLWPVRPLLLGAALLAAAGPASAQKPGATYVRENYTRTAYKVPARDGALLYTIVYAPKDESQAYPILLTRTPYGIGPYADDQYRASLGPNKHFAAEKYIFAYQDVRG